ncbi:MAG TPA: hypothetical protein VM802_15530 [Chitinophaga sp.]|uniref:hypothetical protein n=1 Tax=Chitinophaga sp. TaxID=1869181 RepID=UPI002CDB8E9F|nr:hypothetical protein [Chitinophaga sp.]HVI46286.1 hypothetical protein [Chitinophaga sp.]
MRRIVACLFFLLSSHIAVLANTRQDSLLKELYYNIAKAGEYDAAKLRGIDSTRRRLASVGNNLPLRFDLYRRLYEEYKVFNFDSAFYYARQLEQVAATMQDPVRLTYARTRQGYVLLSSGMFTETSSLLNNIDVTGMPDSIRTQFYLMKSRFYYDLADYSQDKFYSPTYIRQGSMFMDSALHLLDTASFE